MLENNDPIKKNEHPLKHILILSDGIRGHINQSCGVVEWLVRKTGAEVMEIEVPELRGGKRLRAKLAALQLLNGNRRKARDWLALADGDALIREVGQLFSTRNIREGDSDGTLFLSAGSIPAFYNIALGYIWRCTSATIMTPSVVGTALFDFAIVPQHDCPPLDSNILTTLGSPNGIIREELEEVALVLQREFPPQRERSWGVLVGGDDANYRIGRRWVQRTLGRIFQAAEREGADLYIATSRRTSPEAEDAIRQLIAGRSDVRFLLLASQDPSNPVPGMLGLCDEIFCTEDSVNMVSEAITAGHRVVLLRTDRHSGLRARLQAFSAFLIDNGLAPRRALVGIPRFNRVFEEFRKRGYLIEFSEWVKEQWREAPLFGDEEGSALEGQQVFNEAQRAAYWMLDHWGDRER